MEKQDQFIFCSGYLAVFSDSTPIARNAAETNAPTTACQSGVAVRTNCCRKAKKNSDSLGFSSLSKRPSRRILMFPLEVVSALNLIVILPYATRRFRFVCRFICRYLKSQPTHFFIRQLYHYIAKKRIQDFGLSCLGIARPYDLKTTI